MFTVGGGKGISTLLKWDKREFPFKGWDVKGW